MVAKRLAPDHEPGSTSALDKKQNGLMGQLVNAGNTSVPNDQKYIKGHLLNDHVGGPGEALNLFPITADANAKHLVYVEKFIKAQLDKRYVVYYEIKVKNQTIAGSGPGTYSIDADFNFYWSLLDSGGNPYKKAHTNIIESRYNAKGADPFDVTAEYAAEYDKLNLGKTSPQALPQGQWQDTTSQPSMTTTRITPAPGLFSMNPGLLSSASAIPTSSASTTPDFSAVRVKTDPGTGLQFISVRNADVPPFPGNMIVSPGTTVTIGSINPKGGGWTQILF